MLTHIAHLLWLAVHVNLYILFFTQLIIALHRLTFNTHYTEVSTNLPYSNGAPAAISIITLADLIANKGAELPGSCELCVYLVCVLLCSVFRVSMYASRYYQSYLTLIQQLY